MDKMEKQSLIAVGSIVGLVIIFFIMMGWWLPAIKEVQYQQQHISSGSQEVVEIAQRRGIDIAEALEFCRHRFDSLDEVVWMLYWILVVVVCIIVAYKLVRAIKEQ